MMIKQGSCIKRHVRLQYYIALFYLARTINSFPFVTTDGVVCGLPRENEHTKHVC